MGRWLPSEFFYVEVRNNHTEISLSSYKVLFALYNFIVPIISMKSSVISLNIQNL